MVGGGQYRHNTDASGFIVIAAELRAVAASVIPSVGPIGVNAG